MAVETYNLYDKFIYLNGNWECLSSGGSGGGTSDVEKLSDIKDVKLNNPTNGQVLTYENSKWVNKIVGASTLEDLSDIPSIEEEGNYILTAKAVKNADNKLVVTYEWQRFIQNAIYYE